MDLGKVENTFEDALREGHVAVHNFRDRDLPDLIRDKHSGTVRLYLRAGKASSVQFDELQVQRYKSLSEISYEKTDVHLLDGEAIKLLLSKYPTNAPYSLVRIAFRSSWLVGLPGLIRRVIKGELRVRGVVTLKARKRSQRWLAVEYLKFPSIGFSLSSEIGVQGFLDFLAAEKIQYVVMRFYHRLPQLFRTHGDLDILIADDGIEKVRRFLRAHPGPIPIGPKAVSSRYFPPSLAAKIVTNAVDGPAGSKIPAPKEAFLSLAYHALYHKGFVSGIPSRLPNADVNPTPDNDYAGMLAEMAEDLNIQVLIEMESLDEYLNKQGWRPPLEYFEAKNQWLYRRFLTHRHTAEVGLGVLIFKEKALRLGLEDEVFEEIERAKFTVLRAKTFDEEGRRGALHSLRGGNWTDATGATPNDYRPAMAVVVLDKRPFPFLHASRGAGVSNTIRLKSSLRKRFDDVETSIVHSTDNTIEAWEYIEVCFPEDAQAIRESIDEYFLKFGASFGVKLRYSIKIILYYIRSLRIRRLRRQVGSVLVRILIR